MALAQIDAVIEALRFGRRRRTPGRRARIPEADGKARPPGIPTRSDKPLQAVARMLPAGARAARSLGWEVADRQAGDGRDRRGRRRANGRVGPRPPAARRKRRAPCLGRGEPARRNGPPHDAGCPIVGGRRAGQRGVARHHPPARDASRPGARRRAGARHIRRRKDPGRPGRRPRPRRAEIVAAPLGSERRRAG